MIPQRLLSGVCEITTGQLSITQRPPVYTGEASALTVQIAFKFQGVDYDIPETVVAEMYLRYPNTEVMTIATEMAVEDNVATGVLTAEQTGVAGYPLLVIQLTDSDTASVIVACATTVKVSDVRGNLVVDTRPPSPSEIIYVGRSPYIDPVTKNWMVWNVDQGQYVNSGILAEGTQGYTPEISIGVIQSVPTGESAAVRLRGTARYPIMDMDLPRSGDGIGEHEIYQTIAVAEWGGTGPYTYDIADPTINAKMVIVEKWFDDGTVVPADLYATVPSAGHVLLSIAVKPEQSIGLHLSLCTNGTDILEDLSDAIEAVNQAVEDVQDAVEVVEGIGPYDGLDSTSTALALSANQGKRLSDQIGDLERDKADIKNTPKVYGKGTHAINSTDFYGHLFSAGQIGQITLPINISNDVTSVSISGSGIVIIDKISSHAISSITFQTSTIYPGFMTCGFVLNETLAGGSMIILTGAITLTCN